LFFFFLGLLGVGVGVGAWFWISQDLPRIERLADYRPPAVTQVIRTLLPSLAAPAIRYGVMAGSLAS
jgi:hypothetical protein